MLPDEMPTYTLFDRLTDLEFCVAHFFHNRNSLWASHKA
jgi:hypothetical protein